MERNRRTSVPQVPPEKPVQTLKSLFQNSRPAGLTRTPALCWRPEPPHQEQVLGPLVLHQPAQVRTQGFLSLTWVGWEASVSGGWCGGVLLLQASCSERWPADEAEFKGVKRMMPSARSHH